MKRTVLPVSAMMLTAILAAFAVAHAQTRPLPSDQPISFTNVSTSHGEDPHASGVGIELYKHTGNWNGFIVVFVGPVADPPVGKLDGLQLDERTGKIVFTARLSLGVTQPKGAHDWVPTKDQFEFTGMLRQDGISGHLDRKLVDDSGRSTSDEIVLKRETVRGDEKTPYDEWLKTWELRMKARGPR